MNRALPLPTAKLKPLAFLAALVFAIVAPMLASPRVAHATCGTSCTYSDPWGTQEVAGSGWMGGNGVSIYSNGPSAPGGPSPNTINYVNNKNNVSTQSGIEWQCVELVNRLYLIKGWTTAWWQGNGDQIYGNAGTVGLSSNTQPQGSITYVNPGDVIGMSKSGTPGHVAIVSSVSGTSFTIASQNTNVVYDTSFALNNGSVTMSGWSGFTIQGVVHAPTSPGTLYFIKTTNTSSGKVEVHSATPGSNYQSGMHATTWLTPADANNGWFQIVGQDLYFIKTKNTGSGKVEVHSATATSNYQSGIHNASAFSSADANNGWFQMTTGGDLVFIKTTNTGSGRVEFFRASGSSGFSQVVTATATAFYPSDASNGWFQAQGLDLVFIKTKNTGSGTVEYFRAPASSNYQTVTIASSTVFSPNDANNGWFSSEDANNDGTADVAFVKNHNTTSGDIEVFLAYGPGFNVANVAQASWITAADANNGWYQIDSKD